MKVWRRGSRALWLGLALSLLASPLSSWAEPSAKEAAILAALDQAEASLAEAEAALKRAEESLTASREELAMLKEQLAASKLEAERLRGAYATLCKELEALGMRSSELENYLAAMKAEADSLEKWAWGLGLAAVVALVGGLLIW